MCRDTFCSSGSFGGCLPPSPLRRFVSTADTGVGRCKASSLRRCAPLIGLLLGLGGLLGCHGAAQRREPPPEPSTPETLTPAPAVEPGEPELAPDPAHQLPPPPAPVEAGVEPPTPPEPAPPELPEYVRVLERFDSGQKAEVWIELTPPRRLAINTRNVQRLWIDRDALPLARDRSIILQLDGQGIEWTPQSTTTRFERSVNGVWTPAREPRH